MSNEIIRVSSLNKTWILDLDGTLVKHNGYKIDGYDSLLDGVDKLLEQIQSDDLVIIVTSRKEEVSAATEDFLRENKIKYNAIIYNAPYGERILINDKKPSGLHTAVALNTDRDSLTNYEFCVDANI